MQVYISKTLNVFDSIMKPSKFNYVGYHRKNTEHSPELESCLFLVTDIDERSIVLRRRDEIWKTIEGAGSALRIDLDVISHVKSTKHT